jgi:hypothetical protein
LPCLDILRSIGHQPFDLVDGFGLRGIPEIVACLPDLAYDKKAQAAVFQKLELALQQVLQLAFLPSGL